MPFKYDIGVAGFPVMHEFFQRYGVSAAPITAWEPHWGVRPGEMGPIVRVIGHRAKADRMVWVAPKVGLESSLSTTTDRVTGHRCLVPVSSIYEWAPESASAWEHKEHRFSALARKWFMAGGMWSRDGATGIETLMAHLGPTHRDKSGPGSSWRAARHLKQFR